MKLNFKYTILVLLFFSLIKVNGQDMVSNGDFSESMKSPRSASQIKLANGWKDASWGTADFFHKEAKKCSRMQIPGNQMGTQDAYKGDGYAGITAFMDNEVLSFKDGKLQYVKGYANYTEYLTTKLNSALVAGKSYKVTYMVSLAENSGRAVKGLGAFLSKEPISLDGNSFIEAEAQVKSSEMLDNKNDWVEVSGIFTAKGGEEYLAVGVFNGPDEVKRAPAINELNNRRAYYYIDAISVVPGEIKDADKDGVADSEDACPEVAGPAENKGCPVDSDNDGIVDAEDKCPEVKGVAENNGCPADRDGDGVPDAEDKCPDLKGSAKYNGCALSEEEAKVIKDASANIYFETGSDVIKKSSYADLDRLVAILKKHPEVKARVEGHTDNTGNEAKNMTLSKTRAKSVADYLVGHGEPADHISSEGFGITKPVATNDTKEGRAKNRRVEIVVSSYEK